MISIRLHVGSPESIKHIMVSYRNLFTTLALSSLFLIPVNSYWHPSWPLHRERMCIVKPACDGSDDAPAVIEAFEKCGKNGKVVFLNETYSIQSIMNTTGLENCEVDLRGTMLVSRSLNEVYTLTASSGALIFSTGSIILCQWDTRINPRHGSLEAKM